MPVFRRTLTGASTLVAATLFAGPVWAIDLNGAWATDVSLCSKVFKKQEDRVVLTSTSDLYGGGFIIDGNRVRGKLSDCSIESKREDGAIIHLSVACPEELQFDLKVVNDNTVSKTVPGSNSSIDYHRCTL
jgi:hypothetical protein